jgi:hypothetical protein
MVETLEAVMDAQLFTRAAVRTYSKRLWPLCAALLVMGVALIILGQTMLGSVCVVHSFILLPLITYLRVSKTLKTPMNSLAYVNRFSNEALEQLSGGERRAFVRYAEMYSIDEIPEGLRIWIAKNGMWFFIQRTAFKSPADFDSVCQLLINAGKMKARST